MEDIVTKAEKVIQNINRDKYNNILLKTNQIRKFLSAVNMVANKVDVYKATNPDNKSLTEKKLVTEIKYLEVMLVYQVGRDNAANPRFKSVEDFVKKAELRESLHGIGNSIEKFEEFNRYMEALVAFHKFYGGKDK